MVILKKSILRLLLLTAVLFTGCAKIVMPTGGPRDVAPPAIAKESPQNGCNNFKGNTIKITFNEFVTLNNTFENVLISPPLTQQPTYTLSGKTLIIKFNDTLQSNQTYNLGFANCIQDFTEGNPIPFYNYAFSTGEAVDSFMLQGKIIDAQTNGAVKECFVFAYSQNIDSLPLTTKPNYITKTQPNGTFSIKNIRPGDYKLFALKDINNNLIYDLPNEEIAFLENTMTAFKMPVEVPTDTVSGIDTVAPVAEIEDTTAKIPECGRFGSSGFSSAKRKISASISPGSPSATAIMSTSSKTNRRKSSGTIFSLRGRRRPTTCTAAAIAKRRNSSTGSGRNWRRAAVRSCCCFCSAPGRRSTTRSNCCRGG